MGGWFGGTFPDRLLPFGIIGRDLCLPEFADLDVRILASPFLESDLGVEVGPRAYSFR